MNSFKDQLIMFIVMVIIGMLFNPMSMLGLPDRGLSEALRAARRSDPGMLISDQENN